MKAAHRPAAAQSRSLSSKLVTSGVICGVVVARWKGYAACMKQLGSSHSVVIKTIVTALVTTSELPTIFSRYELHSGLDPMLALSDTWIQ